MKVGKPSDRTLNDRRLTDGTVCIYLYVCTPSLTTFVMNNHVHTLPEPPSGGGLNCFSHLQQLFYGPGISR